MQAKKAAPKKEQYEEGENKLEGMLDKIKLHILEKCAYAKASLRFKIDMADIPPVIPPMQRKFEINTENEKRSVYLKDRKDDIKGLVIVQ